LCPKAGAEVNPGSKEKVQMNQPEILVQISDLSFKPAGAEEDVLKNVSLEIDKGDFILLLGPSGCGKTMLTRCINGLIPQLVEGEMRGQVLVSGKDTNVEKMHEFAEIVGLVFQNPDDQILSLKVVDEVAWGVENLGLEHEEIVERVDYWLEAVGIADLKERLTFAISGGQKQKVSVASNLAMLQEMLMLDDPTTDLDPVCKGELVSLLAGLHRERGMTLLVIEHDLNDLIEMANRVVVMDDGQVVHNGLPGELFAKNFDEMLGLGVNVPQHLEIVHAVYEGQPTRPDRYPVLREDAFAVVRDFFERSHELPPMPAETIRPPGETIIAVRDIEFAYEPGKPVLKGLSFEIRQGEFIAIIGANGSGKSTLVNNLIGLLRPDRGDVIVQGVNTKDANAQELAKNIGYTFQNPDNQLFTNLVSEEVGYNLDKVYSDADLDMRIADTLKKVELDGLDDRHPFSLSRGQRQRLAVATALIHDPGIILLDEPTTGQDRLCLVGVLDLMSKQNLSGNTTIMVTHDMDTVAAYATRVIVMNDGEIVLDGTPTDVFYDRYDVLNELSLRPPTVIDFCRRLESLGVPRFVLVEDLVDYIKMTRAGLGAE
jgi:energy-coupling factor transport system ATP-binding protein